MFPRLPALLGACLLLAGPAALPAADHDNDLLPPGARARFGGLRFREGIDHHIRAACCPAANLLATSGQDPSIHLWDLSTGRRLRTLRADAATTGALAFSPDGKLLAAHGHDRSELFLFEVATGKELRRFSGHDWELKGLAFNPDGRSLASLDGKGVLRLWDAANGRLRWCLPARKDVAGPLLFFPDGRTLALRTRMQHREAAWAEDREVPTTFLFWDADTGRERPGFPAGVHVRWFAIAPDGKTLASAGDDVRLWDAAGGKELRRIPWPEARESRYLRLVFAPDGKTLAGSTEQWVFLWDVISGKELRRWRAIAAQLFSWNASDDNRITCLAFTADGRSLVTWAQEDGARVWDRATGAERPGFDGHRGEIYSVAFVDARRVLSRGQDGWRLWEAASGKGSKYFSNPEKDLVFQTFSPDLGTVVYRKKKGDGPRGEIILVREATTGRERWRLDRGDCYCFQFSPDGRFLAARDWDDRRIHLWEAATGKALPAVAVSHGTDHSPAAFAFTPDSLCLFVLDGNTLRLWEIAADGGHRQRLALPLECHADLFRVADGLGQHSPRFVTDGKVVVVVCYGTFVRCWNLDNGKEMVLPTRLWRLPETAHELALSPDGRMLATGGYGGKVWLWETATGGRRCAFEGHQGWIQGLAFSPDSKSLVSGSHDRTALVWDVTGLPGAAALDPEKAWQELAAADAAQAFRALGALMRAPEPAVAFLRQRLRPAVLDPRRLGGLLRRLEDDRFDEREKATAELEELGEAVAPTLRRALASAVPESRKRLGRILEKMDGAAPSAERLRTGRAIEGLERIGSAAAREVLKALAGGAPDAPVTQEARTALERLARQP